MTKLLYYDNPDIFEFTAKVINVRKKDGSFMLELDQTAFYVEGGGQPSDKGAINGAEVLRVFQEDGVVWHEVSAEVSQKSVSCVVDRLRRRDLSVQHTGQHLLSAAFFQLFSAETSSFHLTEHKVTIDLSLPDLSSAQIEEAEALANKMLRQALPVQITTYESKSQLPEHLRKLPNVEGVIRIVEVKGFDACPCGGTHVENTSEIGLIKVLSFERAKGNKTKVEFACGDRAMREFRARLESDKSLSVLLSSPYTGHYDAVVKLMENEKALSREVERLTKEVLEYKASLEQPASYIGSVAFYRLSPWQGSLDEAKLYLSLLLNKGPGVGVAVLHSEPARIVVASSCNLNAANLLKNVLAKFGGKGGGIAQSAQGGFPKEHIDAVLLQIEAALTALS